MRGSCIMRMHAPHDACMQFGVVTVAVCKRTRKRYAMKSISKRKAESDPNFRKDIRTEVGQGLHACMPA